MNYKYSDKVLNNLMIFRLFKYVLVLVEDMGVEPIPPFWGGTH
jgi:hypothetical protein